VRNAGERGMEVLITISGTPKWANGNKSQNVAPTNLADLTAFSRALADRYSGRHAGYPYVGRWSVWNEPNLEQFLKPQFNARGKFVGPAIYAKIYRAAYAGIKAGNSGAQVAIGETSARGRDRLVPGVSGSVSPGKFAELVAKANPRLKFDAWAHHPYPTVPNMKPLQKVRWPNVTLPSLARFEASLDKWFKRKGIPIWITEYGHETKPGEPRGVTLAQQRAYMTTAVNFLRRDPRVHMFIWWIFRDDPTSSWQSGLYTSGEVVKPALATWVDLFAKTNGLPLKVRPGVANPVVRLPVPKIAYFSRPGTIVGMTYRVYDGGKLIAVKQPAVPLRIDASISIPVGFRPVAGKTYILTVDAKDANGNAQLVTAALIATR
jgi:aryl-phospho-beta-D-glucosidase BglC (GH1 family)